jgi:hypothetical protein
MAVLAVLPLLAGCAETLVIRSTPPGAQVMLNGTVVGTTPMVYETKRPEPMTYRIEKEGYPPAEGAIATPLAPGRVVGAVFSLGIVALSRPMHYFLPNPLDVQLGPVGGPSGGIGLLRLHDVRAATVLAGECPLAGGPCSILLPSGERCTGDYVRQAATAQMDRASGLAILRCAQTIIDCNLLVDTLTGSAYGECTDTQRRAYRATLTPQVTDSP